MIDHVKLRCSNQEIINKLLDNPGTYRRPHSNTYHSFEMIDMKTRLDFRKSFEMGILVGYSYVDISISPHYHFNDHLHNGNDFSPVNAKRCFRDALTALGIERQNFRYLEVVNLEFGLNIIPHTPVEDVLRGLLLYKKTEFILPKRDLPLFKLSDTTKAKQIKAYAKGYQFRDQPMFGIDKNTFRFEIRCKKSEVIRKLGIRTADHLMNYAAYENFGAEILSDWQQILVVNVDILETNLNPKDLNFIKQHTNPNVWNKMLQESNTTNRNRFLRAKRKYYKILARDSIYYEILQLLSEKIHAFSKVAQIDHRKKRRQNTCKQRLIKANV